MQNLIHLSIQKKKYIMPHTVNFNYMSPKYNSRSYVYMPSAILNGTLSDPRTNI